MKFTKRRMVVAALCTAAAIATVTAAPSSGAGGTTGVTATSITIGGHDPLTGAAAPGYSEIAPGANAFFSYINAHGGVFGRKINYIYKDDGYNPSNTVTVVRQLVLQNNVFAIFQGLGTPTHSKVVGFLNSSKIPDVLVASGCDCWDGHTYPYTFGWQPDYTIEGKILGQYIDQHFKGKKVGIFWQNDDFGKGGVQGLRDEIPNKLIVASQSYEPTAAGTGTVGSSISAIKASGAQVLVNFTVPVFTALTVTNSFKIGYKPVMVTSSVGTDPHTLLGLLKSLGGATGLVNGMVTDAYLPPAASLSNPWNALFNKIRAKYAPNLPYDGNVEYGEAGANTLVLALKAAGKKLTRAGLVHAMETANLNGPGLVPYRWSHTQHGGFAGTQMGVIHGSAVTLVGKPLTTDDSAKGKIKPVSYKGRTPKQLGLRSP